MCPSWFKYMLAAIILKNLVSFEPFESSLKSSDSVDGRIESFKRSWASRQGTAYEFPCAVKELHVSSGS